MSHATRHLALVDLLRSAYPGYAAFCSKPFNEAVSKIIQDNTFHHRKAKLTLLHHLFSTHPDLAQEEQQRLTTLTYRDIRDYQQQLNQSPAGGLQVVRTLFTKVSSKILGGSPNSPPKEVTQPKTSVDSDAVFLGKLGHMVEEFPVLADVAEGASRLAKELIKAKIEFKATDQADEFQSQEKGELDKTLLRKGECLTREFGQKRRIELITAFNSQVGGEVTRYVSEASMCRTRC